MRQFIESIGKEIESYKTNFSRIGTTLNINIIEDIHWIIGKSECQSLSILYLDEKLGQIELAYIVDGLQLSENVSFSDDQVESILAEMTDPEINGKFTFERAAEIIRMSS